MRLFQEKTGDLIYFFVFNWARKRTETLHFRNEKTGTISVIIFKRITCPGKKEKNLLLN